MCPFIALGKSKTNGAVIATKRGGHVMTALKSLFICMIMTSCFTTYFYVQSSSGK